MGGLIIPSADPVGLPAPVWLLKFLLVLTFILHVVPMSLLLGGSFIAVVTRLIGAAEHSRRLVRHLAGMFPTAMAYATTLGIAPLLFVQLLYGTLFYTSSILMGMPWMGVIVLLVIGYYALYIQAWRGSVWAGIISTAAFMVVAYLITSNLSLMVSPQHWSSMYWGDPAGFQLKLPFLTVLPRYLHAFLLALTLASGYVVLHGHLAETRDDRAYGSYVRSYGSTWLAVVIALQGLVGRWYLGTLPDDVRRGVAGADPLLAVLAGAAVLLTVAGAILLVLTRTRKSVAWATAGMAGLLGGAFSLAILRHVVEDARARQFLPPSAWNLNPQIGLFGLFAVILVLGLGGVAYMLLRVRADMSGVAKASMGGGGLGLRG